MSLINAYVDKEDLGHGLYRNEIAMKPRAVLRNGIWRAMKQELEDSGDLERPHAAMDAPLRVRVANDGMRRFYPVENDDTAYMEMGSPFIQVGGDWTQVSLGTPSRTGHTLTWTRPQTITTIQHGGHFLDLTIELRNGYVPENSRVAFPVGLQGLTRSGLNILRDGNAVARLRPFMMLDAANPDDRRPISHAFTTRNSQPFLVLTLPDLTGMTRPVIDPTLELQPDATAGQDTFIGDSVATDNFGTNAALSIGDAAIDTNRLRSLIKFDLSTVPDPFDTATLSLYAITDYSTIARTFRVFRTKRDWVELQATWNIWKTSNNWSTAGGFHADDCEQVDIASRAFTDTETLNQFKDFPFTGITTKVALDLGNGWLLKADTETDDRYDFASSDHATAANRPKLTVTYTEAAAGGGRDIVPLWFALGARRRGRR